MRFVSVRDLRSKGRRLWEELGSEEQLVVTSNGRPIALLTGVNEENFENTLGDLRRARALRAVEEMQRASLEVGRDKMTDQQIDAEIQAARKARQR